MNRHAKDNAGFSLTAGLILLAFGFYFGIGSYIDHGPFYVFLIHLFRWTVRLSGFAFLVIAGISWMGHRVGLLLDAIVSALCGGVMVGCVIGWMFFERGLDLINVVSVLLGLMLLRSGYTNLLVFRESASDPGRPRGAFPTIVQQPLNISSTVLPKEGEPPPPEGYLAALAKEKDDPPNSR